MNLKKEAHTMVNGLHYTAHFLPGATQSAVHYCPTLTHSCTHSHTDGGVSHARRQLARQGQLGWGVLLRDTLTLDTLGGAGDRTSNISVTSQTALPPESPP